MSKNDDVERPPYVHRTVVEKTEPLPPYLSEVPSGPTVDCSDDDAPSPLVECDTIADTTPPSDFPPVLKQSDDEESLPLLEGFKARAAETAEAILTIIFKHGVSKDKDRLDFIAAVLGCYRPDLLDRLTQCGIGTATFPEAEPRLALALRILKNTYINE